MEVVWKNDQCGIICLMAGGCISQFLLSACFLFRFVIKIIGKKGKHVG